MSETILDEMERSGCGNLPPNIYFTKTRRTFWWICVDSLDHCSNLSDLLCTWPHHDLEMIVWSRFILFDCTVKV